MSARIALVAAHVFKESVRDRVLYAIAAFAILLLAAAVVLGQLTAGQDVKIIKDLGLAVIELAGVTMSVFIGVGLVSREIDRRSIFSVLSKPISRWEFVIGKYFGLVLTIVVNVTMMAAALYLILGWAEWTSPPLVRASWDAPALDPALLVQVVLLVAELALLTAVALLFSTFSSSAILSIGFTLGLFVAGLASDELRHFGDTMDAPAVAWLVTGIGWVVPAFSVFSDRKGDIVHGLVPSMAVVGTTLAYAGVYITAALLLAGAIVSRREFR